jgi:hypothetical protein
MSNFLFWAVFVALLAIIIGCDYKFNMLRDPGYGSPRPYSYARVQLAWWTLVILSSIIGIFIYTGQLPPIQDTTLYMLGISSATTTTATLIDLKDRQRLPFNGPMLQDQNGTTFLYDILSDKNDVTVHRLQAVILNLTVGAWFLQQVVLHHSIPPIPSNYLALLGLSAGVYAGMKTTENKEPSLPQTASDANKNTTAVAGSNGQKQDTPILTQKVG